MLLKSTLRSVFFFSYLFSTFLTASAFAQTWQNDATAKSFFGQISQEEAEKRILELRHVPLNQSIEIEQGEGSRICNVYSLKVPVFNTVTNSWEKIDAELRIPVVDKKVPAVLVVPTIEGATIVEERVANNLCAQKLISLIADFRLNPDVDDEHLDWSFFDNSTKQNLVRLQTLIDYLEQRDDVIEDQKIGVYGLSLGAVMSSQLIAIDPRVQATVLVAAGGNYPNIIANSKQGYVVDLRDRLMAKYNIANVEDFEAVLQDKIRYDSLFFSYRVKTKSVLMTRVTNDDKVPTDTQNQLWEAFGKPSIIDYASGHVGSILKLVFYDSSTEQIKFLNTRFKTSTP